MNHYLTSVPSIHQKEYEKGELEMNRINTTHATNVFGEFRIQTWWITFLLNNKQNRIPTSIRKGIAHTRHVTQHTHDNEINLNKAYMRHTHKTWMNDYMYMRGLNSKTHGWTSSVSLFVSCVECRGATHTRKMWKNEGFRDTCMI